jgi:hypothetical protein
LSPETDEKYGGSMRKIGEQKANSFSYAIYWIDTGEIWGPHIYRGPNATEEFMKRMDIEVKRINKIFATLFRLIRVIKKTSKNSIMQKSVTYAKSHSNMINFGITVIYVTKIVTLNYK